MKTIWQQLKIDPTTNEKAIKKAYASRVKECHQEDEPERWQKLHDAYEQAIQYAKGKGQKAEYKEDIKEEIKEETKEEIKEETIIWENKGLIYEREAIRGELNRIRTIPKGQQAKEWEKFLESGLAAQFYNMEEFWYNILEEVKATRYSSKVYRVILKEIGFIKNNIYMQGAGKNGLIWHEIESICKTMRSKNENRLALFATIIISSIIFLCFMLPYMVSPSKTGTASSMEEKFAQYMGEKYSGREYLPEQFELEMVTMRKIGELKYEELKTGYKVQMKNRADFCGYIVIDTSGEKEEPVCFDNAQLLEIEMALCQELKESLLVRTGKVYLGMSENNTKLGCFKGQDVVYHAKFDGDLGTFFTEERQVRKQAFADYYEDMFQGFSSSVNGAFYFYYPDERFETLAERITMEECEFDSQIVSKLQNMETTYSLQPVAVGMPVECYTLEFESGEISEKRLRETYRKNRETYNSGCPIIESMASIGYWKPTLLSMEESMSTTELTTLENLFEVSSPWVHVSYAKEIEPGIHVLVKENSQTELVPEDVLVKVSQNPKEIVLTMAQGTAENFIFIINKNQFAIGEQYKISSASENYMEFEAANMSSEEAITGYTQMGDYILITNERNEDTEIILSVKE